MQTRFVAAAVRFAACLIGFANAHADVISIESTSTGLFSFSAPTRTFYWQGKDPKAVLLFIPGGAGQIELKPDSTDPREGQIVRRLSDPQATSGRYDVVLIDSPYPVPSNNRRSSDHIKRIEATALYYKKKTGLPVWVVGHSNGGLSLTGFVEHLQSEKKMDLISGMVAAEIRSNSTFGPPIDIPVLFIQHQKDSCQTSVGSEVQKIYDRLKEFDKAQTAFVWITGGAPQGGDPCYSGYHVYHDAGPEVAKAIDGFLSKIYP